MKAPSRVKGVIRRSTNIREGVVSFVEEAAHARNAAKEIEDDGNGGTKGRRDVVGWYYTS